jgi:hypothetical protein
MNAARGKFFWLLVLIGLLPFVIVAFFNSMAADDYLFYSLYRNNGFFKVQSDLYHDWAGRYTSAFIIGCFVRLDLPGRYPWLPTLFYFAATWAALCYLCFVVRRRFLVVSRMHVLQAATLLFFVCLYVQADIATGFYWFSSVVVYQTAFILFLIFVARVIRRLTETSIFSVKDLILYLLILLIAGCNEMIAVFLPLFLISLVFACRFYGRQVPIFLWLCVATSIAAGMFIMLTSGVLFVRRPLLNAGTGYLHILPIIGFQTIAVLYYIFKEPFFWLAALLFFGLGVRLSPEGVAASASSLASSSVSASASASGGLLAPFRRKNIFLPGLLSIFALLVLSLTAFLMASRGSIPPRTLNNLSDMLVCLLLTICFLSGVNKSGLPVRAFIPGLSPALGLGVVMAVIMSSTNYLEAWKTVFSGYFYHAVLTDRDRLLRAAAVEHRHSAVVLTYDAALQEKINCVFPHGVFKSVQEILQEKPAMLYYFDGAGSGDRGYAHFYGLDSIIMRQK